MWDSKTLGLAEKKEERKEGEAGDGGKEAKEEGERIGGEEGGGRGRKWEGINTGFLWKAVWFSKLHISKAILSAAVVLIIIAAMWPSCFPGHLICDHVWERLNSTD